jgi:hypothetical protein
MDPLVLAGLPLLPVALVQWMRRRHPAMPRGWWLSQSETAILHRRMHRSIDATRRAVARSGSGVPAAELEALTEDLDAQAIAIDAKLVEASRLPSKLRQEAVVQLKRRVVETEQLAGRVRQLTVDAALPAVADADDGNRRIRERLDALDQARREAFAIAHPQRADEPAHRE